LLRHIKAQRIFERVLVTLSWRVARRLEGLLGTGRLQPQLQLLVCAALSVGAAPLYARGIGIEGPLPAGFDFVFGMSVAVAGGEGGRKFEPARRRCFAAMARHPLP
jgi:multicomponent K+:H+ antiporter subunit A